MSIERDFVLDLTLKPGDKLTVKDHHHPICAGHNLVGEKLFIAALVRRTKKTVTPTDYFWTTVTDGIRPEELVAGFHFHDGSVYKIRVGDDKFDLVIPVLRYGPTVDLLDGTSSSTGPSSDWKFSRNLKFADASDCWVCKSNPTRHFIWTQVFTQG